MLPLIFDNFLNIIQNIIAAIILLFIDWPGEGPMLSNTLDLIFLGLTYSAYYRPF